MEKLVEVKSNETQKHVFILIHNKYENFSYLKHLEQKNEIQISTTMLF